MGNKIDLPRIESYSLALTEKLVSQFFTEKPAISGTDILKFTPVEQVNLFIIKNLFEKWKEETARLKSPYFDFDNEEVKKSFAQFANTLSNHILIRKEFFKPLMQKAVTDTISYLLCPLDFLKAEFLTGDIIQLKDISEKVKYFRINKVLASSLEDRLSRETSSVFSREKVDAVLNEVYALKAEVLEKADHYLDVFSGLLSVKLNDLIDQPEPVKVKEETAAEAPLSQVAPVLQASESQEESKKTESFRKEEAAAATNNVNQKFAKEQLTLNDMLMQDKKVSTLADKLSKARIVDLKSSIPLNQKFYFINELFKGDSGDFNNALNMLQNCQSLEDAHSILTTHYANKYQWDLQKPEIQHFYQIVERKFL